MLRITTLALVATLFSLTSRAGDYEDAWTAINHKKYAEAKRLLEKAKQQPATALDAYITLLFLQTYQGNESTIPGLAGQILASPDKNAYLFSVWFNGAVLGQYNKKKDYQLDLANKVLADNGFNGSIVSATHYVKAMHYVFANEYNKAKAEWATMGSVQDWQLIGPFENISGSGFNSRTAIMPSESSAVQKGINNIDVSWFTPAKLNKEGWIFTYPHLPYSTAIIYAQSFVYAPEDMKVLVNVGANGSLKVWVNDGLVLSDAKERATELDYYKNYCQLKKGYNRVLLQLGYTGNSFPNYILRFTDENLNPVKGLTSSTNVQPYQRGQDAASTSSLKHFAESFFEQRIKAQPANLVNYLLLSQALLRDQRPTEARRVVEQALKQAPDNPLIRFEMVQCLSKAENRTVLLKEIEWLKQNDPESYITFQMKVQELINEEKYDEADGELGKMVGLYGDDENTMQIKAKILGKMDKMDELLKLVEKGFAKNPENVSFLAMKFQVQKMIMKDLKSALAVYEKYLKNNYNYNVLTNLAGEYKDQGQHEKYLQIIKGLYDQSGYDPKFVNTLSQYYFEKQNYPKALEFAREALQLAPYDGSNWYNLASIQDAMNDKAAAISSYEKTIYYDRTNYDARKKLNALRQKTDLYKLLPENDIYAIIKKAPADKENDFTYLLDDRGVVIYDEGASEIFVTYAVKLQNQKGIDSWKEVYLNYSPNTQSLLVEKTEVVKANGSKVPAEREDDHVVFTGLEPGDAIYVKYKVQNYAKGRLGREFWDKFTFNSFVPALRSRYTLVAPKTFTFNHQVSNSKLKPVIIDKDDFKVYTWDLTDMPALKSEPLMPPLNDVAEVLHISSLKSWADVANWYSDVSYQNLSDNFELTEVYQEIFPTEVKRTEFEKARMIYNWIEKNIRYSSVSFRQSGLVPQDMATIISTRLGDCKDVSSLFVALLGKAGIKGQLVLIDTRDNGIKDMLLPSMEFNHCIALAKLDGKEYYIELTDSDLPFNSLPTNLYGALALVIPTHGEKATGELKQLYSPNRMLDRSVRNISVKVEGKDEKVSIDTRHFGSLTSGWRDGYANSSETKQREDMEHSISAGYKNSVKLDKLSFTGLDELTDSIQAKYSYTVKNEVVEAGSMRMFKVPLVDVVATLDNLSMDSRLFPIEYWNYENTDVYETNVTIELPAGQKFIEIPTNQTYSFKGSTYSIKYALEGAKLKVSRKARVQRENIQPEEYQQFRTFFNNIVETESKYIVFK